MTKDEALEMACQALIRTDRISGYPNNAETIFAIKEVLAQPEQEPVATVESVATVVSESGNQEITMSWWHEPALPVGTKLYTTPPQRTWVGLTDEDWDEIFGNALTIGEAIKVTKAKLKEKNK